APRSARNRRGAAGGCGSMHCLHRGVPTAFLSGLVGGYRRPAQLLQGDRLVRGQRRVRDPSLFLALVELAADATAHRLLAEFSEDRQGLDHLGWRKSRAVVGWSHGGYHNRGTRLRATPARTFVSG